MRLLLLLPALLAAGADREIAADVRSPYHRERVRRQRGQTHVDYARPAMRRLRAAP